MNINKNILFARIIYFYLSHGRKTMDTINFSIHKTKSLDIKKLFLCLNAFNQAMNEYIYKTTGENIKLELQSVEKGSDIFNLIIIGGGLFLASGGVIKAVNQWLDFIIKIKDIKSKDTIESIKNNPIYSKTFIQNLGYINKFIIDENIEKISIKNNKNIIFITDKDASIFIENLIIINNIKGYSTEPAQRIYENMMLEFYQTTNTDKDIKHKAFCYEISDKPIPTLITDETLKQIVLDNPYNYRFLVDLEVYKNTDDKILNYRAFNYKDKILKE